MLEFYRMLENMNPNAKNLAMTAIEGNHAGEKAVISNQELIWETDELGFYSSNLEEVEQLSGNGVFSVAGETIYAEMLGNEKKIVICGGGHVSIPIIKIALMTGFHVTVIEDRPLFADNARRAGAHKVICQEFETALSEVPGDADTFFVIVTRGHKYDHSCLGAIAMKPHAYMGMIGSRRRIALVKELLIEEGIPAEKLSDLHAPIGLNIGAQTPEEIAVAIIGEIIQAKNQCGRSGGYSPEILKGILSEKSDCKKVLATIVKRAGSAPRDVGTKMLIMEDGSFVGTVGGGCAEARVIRQSLRMMEAHETSPFVYHVDLSADTAEEEGMVCGGQVDVLLEVIG